ncbi:hypothetical protein BDA96_01G377000 [Sorghum bicolor]|uniref:Uncharacterized protein n=1 Tax=Sorghum bicolor TaxID=4558 RepID=A0A921S3S2_SORBI|nr:hypothetical protein BDA96_01G377000 [Sorghum bicolor]
MYTSPLNLPLVHLSATSSSFLLPLGVAVWWVAAAFTFTSQKLTATGEAIHVTPKSSIGPPQCCLTSSPSHWSTSASMPLSSKLVDK